MTLAYCINTFNSFDRCVEAVHAVMKNSVLPDKLIIIDDSGTAAALDKLIPVLTHYYESGYTEIQVWVHDHQCGVAASWNQFIRDADTDYVLIANDDVFPHVDSIARMITAAKEHADDIFFAGDGYSGNSFSFFMVPRVKFVDAVGYFDECFFPSYFEDNAKSREITLAGYKHIFVDGATYDHVGSSTLHAYTPEQTRQHHHNFERNKAIYIAMWGGAVGEEVYHIKWNGEPPPWANG